MHPDYSTSYLKSSVKRHWYIQNTLIKETTLSEKEWRFILKQYKHSVLAESLIVHDMQKWMTGSVSRDTKETDLLFPFCSCIALSSSDFVYKCWP